MELYEPTNKKYVHIVKISKKEIDKIGIEIGQQPRETLQSFYDRQAKKPNLVTNLGLFGMNSAGLPCFSLVSNHQQYAYDGLRTEGFGITDSNELLYGRHKERDWKDFCSAYPMLIKEGKKTIITYATELAYKTRRTCIGYDANYIYVICVDSPGMTYDELQNLGLSLGLSFMLNADGGGSSRMIYDGKTITNGLENRAVDNMLVIYLKTSSSTTPTKNPIEMNNNKGVGKVNIIEDIIPQKGGKVRPGDVRQKKWIVIHETGNSSKGADAKNHSTYLKNLAKANTTYVSWHYTVDDHAIYHHIPDNEIAYHASDGRVEGGGNMASIGIEICVNSDGNFDKARDNAAWLTAKLLKEHNLTIGAVKQHHDFAPDGKNCPQTIRDKGLWNNFLQAVQKYYGVTNSSSSSNTTNTIVPVFKVGQVVQFNGTKHYKSSDAIQGYICKPGKVKVNNVYRVGKSRHPYMVIAVSGGGSTAYGWVDATDLQEIAVKTFMPYTVRVTANVLNVRSGPGTRYKVTTSIKKNEVYTIVEEKNGWGKLKSGAGWISLKYTKKK
jgi:N-acetylmuramoyl-L-alanine amidase CwlA|nr:MAG TPA: N-acetylmuramoyl-L-alanine amidase [Caudoviricetes sp.]